VRTIRQLAVIALASRRPCSFASPPFGGFAFIELSFRHKYSSASSGVTLDETYRIAFFQFMSRSPQGHCLAPIPFHRPRPRPATWPLNRGSGATPKAPFPDTNHPIAALDGANTILAVLGRDKGSEFAPCLGQVEHLYPANVQQRSSTDWATSFEGVG
jgi:hypothetical protein